MDIFNFDKAELLSFYLTLFRISIVLFMLPFFGSKTIPTPVKGALVLIITLSVWPALSFPAELFPNNIWDIGVLILGEAFLGLTLSIAINVLFAAIQTGGHLMGFQMGFAMVNVVDPVTGVNEGVTAHFLYMTTMLTFLALNGHLYLISGVAQSFEMVPPGQLFISPALVHNVFDLTAEMFVLAIRIASPLMVAILLVDLSLALISRAAPQMNVLLLGFPIKILVGFVFLVLIFEVMTLHVGEWIASLNDLFYNLLYNATKH
ncbi:MAG: flagellar biosynthetic protein FliR [Desulfovibrio sp.]